MQLLVDEHVFSVIKNHKIYFTGDGSNSTLKIGQRLNIAQDLRLEPYAGFFQGSTLCNMGSFSYTHTPFPETSKIGRYCSIAGSIRFFSVEHPKDRFTTSSVTYDPGLPIFKFAVADAEFNMFTSVGAILNKGIVSIGNDVWIGSHVALSGGIHIGNGSIVATGAVVTKDVPPYAVVGGVPAKVLKYRFSDEIITDLLALNWWDYKFTDFPVHSNVDLRAFINIISDEVRRGNIKPYSPKPLLANDLLSTPDK